MKILIFLKKWAGGVGGGVKNIKKELEKLGHEVITISREEDLKIFSAKEFLKSRKEYIKIIKRENPDIIYTQDWSIALPLLIPFPTYYNRHFCCFHGNQFGKIAIAQDFVGFVMGKHLICMAPSIKKRFPKANLNYCGVNLEQFKSNKSKREFLGWIDKGTEIINREDAGKISEELKIPLLIAKGFTHEEMNDKFYSKCKIFMSFPPESAGFQASWLEAMANGVPKIIGNNNGAGEVQPFDKLEFSKNEDYIKTIAEAIRNSKERDYREWIKDNNFTWERHAKRLIEIFNQI